MGLLDKFKKQPTKKKKADLAHKKKEAKKHKEKEAEKKKKQFQAVPGAGSVAPAKEQTGQPAKKDEKKSAKPKPVKEDTGDAYKILIMPIITEKTTAMSVNNQYVFMVARRTNKIEVKKAIAQVYGVTPVKVRIINVKGKEVKTGRVTGRTKDWKKAIVSIKEGEKIEIYETVKK